MNKAKTYTCPSCKTKSEKIAITSTCRQTLHIGTNSFTNTDVGETLHGFCLNCCAIIPMKKLKTLTGLITTDLIPTCMKLLVHKHKYGTSTAFFNSELERQDITEEEAIKLAKLCGLDFEPNKDFEELDILDVPNMKDIPYITKEMLK